MLRTISLILAVSCVPAWATTSVEESWVSQSSPAKLGVDPQQMPLNAIDDVAAARVTFYNPQMHGQEGGPRDSHDELVNAFEDSEKNGRPVTLAADTLGKFGRECNQESRRCTILVVAKGFDKLFPGYRVKFPGLPKDSFLGIVEDTGGDFRGTAGKRFDLASKSKALANGSPDSFNTHVRWIKVKNPCGEDAKARLCDFSGAVISTEAMDKIAQPPKQEASLSQSRR